MTQNTRRLAELLIIDFQIHLYFRFFLRRKMFHRNYSLGLRSWNNGCSYCSLTLDIASTWGLIGVGANTSIILVKWLVNYLMVVWFNVGCVNMYYSLALEFVVLLCSWIGIFVICLLVHIVCFTSANYTMPVLLLLVITICFLLVADGEIFVFDWHPIVIKIVVLNVITLSHLKSFIDWLVLIKFVL